MNERLQIISLHVDHTGFNESLDTVINLAEKGQPAYVCFANVHMTIEAYKSKTFFDQVQSAALVLADGKPIAVACKILHHKKQERIAGMDFMPRLLELANEKRMQVFFYGSTPEVLKALKQKISLLYPTIIHSGYISPTFGVQKEDELARDIDQINHSGAQLVFVSLGCPKQEKWMAANSKKINAVLLGIGAALPVMAGIHKRAPVWMQKLALEWFYRLMQQPGRLFKRYLFTNSMFVYLLTRQRVKKLLK